MQPESHPPRPYPRFVWLGAAGGAGGGVLLGAVDLLTSALRRGGTHARPAVVDLHHALGLGLALTVIGLIGNAIPGALLRVSVARQSSAVYYGGCVLAGIVLMAVLLLGPAAPAGTEADAFTGFVVVAGGTLTGAAGARIWAHGAL